MDGMYISGDAGERQKIHMPAPDSHAVPDGSMRQTVKRHLYCTDDSMAVPAAFLYIW